MSQCNDYSTSNVQCCYVEGHSGEHLFPVGREDLSDEIRLKVLRDRQAAMQTEIDHLRTLLDDATTKIARFLARVSGHPRDPEVIAVTDRIAAIRADGGLP